MLLLTTSCLLASRNVVVSGSIVWVFRSISLQTMQRYEFLLNDCKDNNNNNNNAYKHKTTLENIHYDLYSSDNRDHSNTTYPENPEDHQI